MHLWQVVHGLSDHCLGVISRLQSRGFDPDVLVLGAHFTASHDDVAGLLHVTCHFLQPGCSDPSWEGGGGDGEICLIRSPLNVRTRSVFGVGGDDGLEKQPRFLHITAVVCIK